MATRGTLGRGLSSLRKLEGLSGRNLIHMAIDGAISNPYAIMGVQSSAVQKAE
jgi:hypothetical protein